MELFFEENKYPTLRKMLLTIIKGRMKMNIL
jgi:hypothetical protein